MLMREGRSVFVCVCVQERERIKEERDSARKTTVRQQLETQVNIINLRIVIIRKLGDMYDFFSSTNKIIQTKDNMYAAKFNIVTSIVFKSTHATEDC